MLVLDPPHRPVTSLVAIHRANHPQLHTADARNVRVPTAPDPLAPSPHAPRSPEPPPPVSDQISVWLIYRGSEFRRVSKEAKREYLHGVNCKDLSSSTQKTVQGISCSKGCQSQDIQINPVQAMDDSLIVSKSSLIESENHNAFSKSEIETQMQRQEEKVNMLLKQLMLGWLSQIESSGTKTDHADTSSSSGKSYTTQCVDADIGPVNDEGAIC
ncbi:hypothetical protein Tco_0505506 [Tanacetum coccineum]